MNKKFFYKNILTANFLEMAFPMLAAFLLPWVIIFAIPKFQFGYYGQIEGQITLMHLICSILIVNLYIIVYRDRQYLALFKEPVIYIPLLISILSLLLSFCHRIPALAMFGSPQLGQGVFWYLDLAVLSLIYFIVWSNKNIRIPLLINLLAVIIFVTLFSFIPSLGVYKLRFFYFYDYLCFYVVCFVIIAVTAYKDNSSFFNLNNVVIFLYFILGPYFLLIKNESALFFWFLIPIAAAFIWLFKKYNNVAIFNYFYKCFYNPKFFVFVTVLCTFSVLMSSLIFWDGVELTEFAEFKILNYASSLIARGTIISVLLEHMYSVKAILVGYGWGSTQELLISSFTREVFYQINTGNRVHFHTHNELFEHFLSIGFFGGIAYILYSYRIFKNSFTKSELFPYLWLLYFLLSTVWFQFISSIPLLALAVSTQININNTKYGSLIISKNGFKLVTLGFIFIFFILFMGAIFSLLTNKNTEDWGAERILTIAKNSKPGNCSDKISDYGKGQHYLAQIFNGYTQYIKVQVDKGEKLVKSDVDAIKWFFCATDEVIKSGKASIELINQDINTMSYLATPKASLKIKNDLDHGLEEFRKDFMPTWEERLKMLLNLAPRRSDQFTQYISTLLSLNNKGKIKDICSYIRNNGSDLAYCDLAEAAILIEEGKIEKAVILIENAEKLGAFDRKIQLREGAVPVDEDLVKVIREFVDNYRNK